MRLILKFPRTILFIAIITLISCSKNSDNYPAPPPPPSQTIIDTLSGKEFTFSDLTWDYWLDSFSELYVSIENRPDLFSVDRVAELFVKSITDTAWVMAQNSQSEVSPGYNYSIYLKHLYVYPYPYIQPWSANTQLAGSRVSLKIKFL